MGLDLTGRNGTEGRIGYAVESHLRNAVATYCPDAPPTWEYGDEMDGAECEAVAAALERAADEGFFDGLGVSPQMLGAIRALRIEEILPASTQVDTRLDVAQRARDVAAFLRTCGGGFTAV